MNPTDDDFEIEVTNLHTGATIRRQFASHPPGEPARDTDAADAADDIGADADDDDLPRPPTPRRHRLRTAIVSGVLLLAIALVVVVNPVARSSFVSVFRLPTPQPSPTPLPGANIVYLTHGAPWGIVTLDGKRPPFTNLGMMSAWIKLTPGRHTVVVTQQPFPTVHCTISMPAASSDTCPLASPLANENPPFGADPNNPNAPDGSRFIDLGARFDQLPPDAQDALVTAASAILQPPSDAPTILQPGDHYVRDDGRSAVAQTPLWAIFVPTLLPPAGTLTSDNPSCVSFCDLTGNGMSTGGTWDILVSLLGSWRITTATGQVVANHAPMFSDDLVYTGLSPAAQLALSVLWTGSWQVSQRNDIGYGYSPVCQAAQEMMEARLASGNVSSSVMNVSAARTPEQGCLVNISLSDPAKSAPIYILYHFGMLLAANDAAHQAFPALALASANERALVRQILAEPYNP